MAQVIGAAAPALAKTALPALAARVALLKGAAAVSVFAGPVGWLAAGGFTAAALYGSTGRSRAEFEAALAAHVTKALLDPEEGLLGRCLAQIDSRCDAALAGRA